MRIPCPYCGPREAHEFTYLGAAGLTRPEADDPAAAYAYAYLRDNPAGPLAEHWYHGQGCRSWLVVTRNTTTHEISGAQLATEPQS